MESVDLVEKQKSLTSIEKPTVNTTKAQENVIKNNTSVNKSSDGYTNNVATITTIQNIYDDKSTKSNQKSNLPRSNSIKSRISKTVYLQLHRQASYPSTSTVDRLKGRYEDISKANDNTKANIVIRAKVNDSSTLTNKTSEHTNDNSHTPKNIEIIKESQPNNSKQILSTQTLNEPNPAIHENIQIKQDNNSETGNFSNTCEDQLDTHEKSKPEQALTKTKANIEKLQSNLTSRLSTTTIEQLRNKYSPASYGYPKQGIKPIIPKKVQFSENISKIPIPTPRTITSKQVNEPENPHRKSIQSVVVKEISVPTNDSKTEVLNLKDENFNVVDAKKPNIQEPIPIISSGNTLPKPHIEDQNFTEVSGIELEVKYENIKFAEPEEKHFIVRRCSSEDSIEKFESILSDFIMEKKTKERKRSNSFRKLLSGGFFGKDKKKPDENKLKNQKKDNVTSSDNEQNESQIFDRNSSHRHTVDIQKREPPRTVFDNKPTSGPLYYYSSSKPFRRTLEEGESYTEMSNSGSFVSNRPPKYSPEHYLPMDNGNASNHVDTSLKYNGINRYLDTSSSSSNTVEYDSKNSTYQNALIAQAEMRQIRENENKLRKNLNANHSAENKKEISGSTDRFRESPTHTPKNVQLVKPKALIPINSERPLPNPYHNKPQKIKNTEDYQNLELSQTLDRNLNLDNSKPYPEKSNLYNKSKSNQVIMEDIYGTVFDSISPKTQRTPLTDSQRYNCVSPDQRGLASPKSLEGSKLKLPPNREKVELQPRIRSPIPPAKVSTDKIIATELLRNKRSPTRTSPVVRERSIDRYSSPSRPSSYQGSTIYENTFQFPDRSRTVHKSSTPSVSPDSRNLPDAKTYSNEYIQFSDEVIPNTKSSKPADNQSYLQAAEWHRKQRELDKSPAIEVAQQVTTDVMVHAIPLGHNQRYSTPSSPSARSRNLVLASSPTRYAQQQSPSPQNLNSTSLNNLPLQLQIPHNSPSPKAEKQHILQNVEAFYWRELRKLKDKEDQDLMNYRRQQMQVYGYIEDPVLSRRSRSASPSIQRGRRSLSLPRDARPVHITDMRSSQPVSKMPMLLTSEPIPEGRPVIAKRPIALPTEGGYVSSRQPVQRNPNFIRNTFERSTIGPIGMNKYHPASEDFKGHRQTAPIFKRGSLTVNPNLVPPESLYQMEKKVSFFSNQNPTHPTSWPTKNGFTKSPPTRRVDRELSFDDDVFLSNNPFPHQNSRAEELYIQRRSQNNQQRAHQHVFPNTGSQSSVANSQYDCFDGRSEEGLKSSESLYGNMAPKTITVSNKVCDIYGQIHDPRQKPVEPPQDYGRVVYQRIEETPYGQIRQSGLVYGQLQNPNAYNSAVLQQSQNQVNSPSQNFVRGTRLTASVNDMYRRYPVESAHYSDSRYNSGVRYVSEKGAQGPQRPLPPVPERRDSRAISVRKLIRGYVPVSDNESGSEAGEVQRILRSGTKQTNYNVIEEEWNSDGKSGRASGNESGGGRGENEGEIKSGRSRSARREDPRRHTLSGDQHYTMAGQGGPLSRTMDLENFYFQGQFPRGYPPSSNAMLFDDDPGIMSEVETSSTGFRRGGKQRSSLPVVRTPSKTLERPLGLVFLQYRNETKRALLPNEITSIDTVKALFVRSFPKQLSMEYLDSPLVKIYIHDSSKDMFYELEDVRSHLREIRDRSVLRLFESTDVSGGLPMGGVGIPGGVGHFEDPSYFSEPEFDSEYQHQHIHKSKGSTGKAAPYYMGSTTSLPRSGPLLRPYSPAVGALPPDRLKPLPAGSAPPKPQRAYSSGASRSSDGSSRPPDRFAPFQRPCNPLFNLPDGYMSSPERGSRAYEDPYYSQYTSRSGSITPVIDEEVSDTELLDEQYSLYGVKLSAGGPRGVRSQFPGPAAAPYDTTRLRVEHMERQLANLTGLVQKALTQTPTPRDFLAPPGRDSYRSDKSVSFEKSVSFSDEPPDMNSPKQHSPQHAEKDRLKPAPPPKPASLSPGQYDGRHIYRDLQLTPEMYNQLRGLQKKAKDLRAEVRNLRRMSQAQAHSVKETIRDTFIKIRAMLMAGGEQVWQAGMDQERVRLSRDEDLYKQEMIRLEKDLTDLEASVEELRGNVINRKTRVNMSDVENMALVLSKSSKTVADLKLRFPGLQDSMKTFLSSEMDKVVREEKFLKEEPERLESALRRCKKLTGTLVTLKRLASVQEQRLPCSTSATDGRISPSITETPPITPTSGQHSKPPSGARMGQVSFGGDNANTTDSNQRPENALDALLDELQTFSKPHPATVNTQMPQASYSDSTPSDPPAIPIKGIPPSHSAHFSHPHMSEIGRKGSMDSAVLLPTQNLTVTTATGSLRRLHSYPSGSDTDNSPPIQPLKTQIDGKSCSKPPIPERNADLFQHISGKRVPPPPPPRTSSKSPLASPTSPSLPPRSPATGLQHIQNVQSMAEKPQSQFEAATQNLGLSTLRRNVPNRSSIKDNKSQTLPRNIGSNLQVHTQPTTPGNELQNVSSSSCESVNSQDGTKKGSRKEELEQRHQELLKKQKALQEQYARLQQLQRGNNTLAVVPPAPDQLLKKTGSESNLLQKMGLQMATTQMTGSLTHLPSTTANTIGIGNNVTNTSTNISTTQSLSSTKADTSTTENNINSTTTSKVYETDIL